jgi:hypothetical protein
MNLLLSCKKGEGLDCSREGLGELPRRLCWSEPAAFVIPGTKEGEAFFTFATSRKREHLSIHISQGAFCHSNLVLFRWKVTLLRCGSGNVRPTSCCAIDFFQHEDWNSILEAGSKVSCISCSSICFSSESLV